MTAVTTLVRVTLTLSTPWAVGATPDGSTDVDLPLLIDPRYLTRRPHLPSTSLAGALREHLGADATDWLGPPPPVDDEQPRTPSILCSLGVVLTGAHQLTTYGTTAIDHRRGAARAGSLRLEERAEPAVVSASDKASGSQRAQLTWCLTADEPLPDQLLERLAAWAPYIGRSRSTGMGSTSPLCVEALQLDLDQPEHLTWWLTHRRQWLTTGTGHPRGTTPARFAKGVHRHRLPFGFEVVDPIALGTGAHDTHRASPSERQAAPREIRRSHDRPIVPGSSWKGVFRHRVSFILTALNAEETLITEVVLLLFGAGPKDPGGAHRGLLRFADSTLTGPDPKAPAIRDRSHVAIDRISGGADDGKLFRVRAVEPGAQLDLIIETDRRLPEPVERLLRWVAKDLHDGLIGIGGLTTRGYGTVRLRSEKSLPTQNVDLDALATAVKQLVATRDGGGQR